MVRHAEQEEALTRVDPRSSIALPFHFHQLH